MAERLDQLTFCAKQSAESYSAHMLYGNQGLISLSRSVFLRYRMERRDFLDKARMLAWVCVDKKLLNCLFAERIMSYL